MKKALFVLSLIFFSNIAIGQELKSNNLFQRDSSLFQHVLDFELGEPGGVGYNLFYKPWDKISIGARVGLGTRKSGVDIVPENSRRSYFATYNLFIDYSVWKSNYLEIGLGYYDAWSWPTETNIEVIDFPVYSSGFFEIRTGVKTYLFDKVMIRLASKFQYDVIPNKWFLSPSFSLGYKF